MTKQEWMEDIRKKQYPWMSNSQFECYWMLCDIFGGANHVYGKVKPCGESGIEVNETPHMSTYDFDMLTKAVVFAHDRAIRFSILPSGPGLLKLVFHKRQRDGDISISHPTIEDTIARVRKI